jgi:hypothetical protein
LLYLYVRLPLWNPDAPTLSTLLLAAESAVPRAFGPAGDVMKLS